MGQCHRDASVEVSADPYKPATESHSGKTRKIKQSISKRERFGLCPFPVVIHVSGVSNLHDVSTFYFVEENNDEILIQSCWHLFITRTGQPPASTSVVNACGCVSMSVAKMISTDLRLIFSQILLFFSYTIVNRAGQLHHGQVKYPYHILINCVTKKHDNEVLQCSKDFLANKSHSTDGRKHVCLGLTSTNVTSA